MGVEEHWQARGPVSLPNASDSTISDSRRDALVTEGGEEARKAMPRCRTREQD